MSKTWYGHHIETIKGEDYVLHKDYTELQNKLDKEIERLKNELAKIPKAKMEYDLEIERLNNIINELEKSWKEQQEYYRYRKDNRYRSFLSKNLYKLKELKESDNNES